MNVNETSLLSFSLKGEKKNANESVVAFCVKKGKEEEVVLGKKLERVVFDERPVRTL